MIYPVKPIDLSIPSVGITPPQYQSDYQIDGFSTERSGNVEKPENNSGGAFCLLTTTETGTVIRGGLIYCGDQNWNIDPQDVATTTDGSWLVYLEVDVTVNTDDAGELLLPNVKTGTKPTGDWGILPWSTGTDYPSNSNPSIPSGDGTIVIPIGKLTIADGVASLAAESCGSITITHCAGTLSHTRG